MDLTFWPTNRLDVQFLSGPPLLFNHPVGDNVVTCSLQLKIQHIARQRCVCLARASVKFTFLHVHAFVGSGEFSMLSHIWTKPLGCNLEPKANQGIPVNKPSVQELKRHWLLPVKLSLTKESLFCCTNNLIRRSLKFNLLFLFDSLNCRSSSIINVCWSNPHKKREGLFVATPNR